MLSFNNKLIYPDRIGFSYTSERELFKRTALFCISLPENARCAGEVRMHHYSFAIPDNRGDGFGDGSGQ